MKNPFHRTSAALRNAFLGLCVSALLFWLVVTEPPDSSPVLGSRIDSTAIDLFTNEAEQLRTRGLQTGVLSVGWARRSITPAIGTPTYGYRARLGRGITSIADSVFVYAVAVAAGEGPPVVFLSAEICTWVRPVSDRVLDRVASMIGTRDVYFLATHTHSGPGGYAKGYIDRLIMGGIDEKQIDLLVNQSVRVVRDALADLSRSGYRELTVSFPRMVRNRIDHQGPVDSDLTQLEFVKKTGERGTLILFGAHATTINSESRVCSGDYPSSLMRSLTESGYEFAMFAASVTAQNGPVLGGRRASDERTSVASSYGTAIAEGILANPARATVPFRDSIETASVLLGFPLPEYQYRFMGRILRPGITRMIFADERGGTIMHGIRLGRVLMIGLPFEVSSVMSGELKSQRGDDETSIVFTGFNRDDFLYIVPERYYETESYEPRVSLFGPYFEEYVRTRSLDMIDLLSGLDPAVD